MSFFSCVWIICMNFKISIFSFLLNVKAENRRSGRFSQRRRPVLLPHLPVPSAPPPSTFNPTPPLQNTPFLNSEGQQVKVDSDGASPNNAHPPVDENIKVQTKEPEAAVSLTESTKLHPKSSGPVCSPSPPSRLSQGSFSDLSQPPSSVFSRSTNLSGWISGLSGKSKLELSFSLEGLKLKCYTILQNPKHQDHCLVHHAMMATFLHFYLITFLLLLRSRCQGLGTRKWHFLTTPAVSGGGITTGFPSISWIKPVLLIWEYSKHLYSV